MTFLTEILGKDMKEDLNDGLNSYLSSMQETAQRQNEQCATLVQERAEMLLRIKELEQMTELFHTQQSDVTGLQEVSKMALYCVWYIMLV